MPEATNEAGRLYTDFYYKMTQKISQFRFMP